LTPAELSAAVRGRGFALLDTDDLHAWLHALVAIGYVANEGDDFRLTQHGRNVAGAFCGVGFHPENDRKENRSQ
jgi:superfamily II helicase